MKDLGNRLFRLFVGLFLLAYIWYIYMSWLSIVWADYDFMVVNNLISVIFVIVLSVLLIFDWIKPICFNKPRLTYSLFWVMLIFIWAYSIIDNPSLNLYLWDILRLLWAIIVILWLSWLLTPNSCIKKKEEEKIEIIEA